MTKRVIAALTLLISLAGLIFLVMQASAPEYVAIYHGLGPEDASKIDSIVRSMSIEPRWAANQTVLSVPANRADEVRLRLNGEGLPNGGIAGYDLMNETQSFVPNEIIKTNKLRALQGELAKTIMRLEPVQSAKVMLSIPEATPFLSEQNPPKASVVVNLKDGERLSYKNVRGIIHLVSHAVDGLTDNNVTVVDGKGNLLQGGEPEGAKTALDLQMQIRREFEEDLQKKIQSMLDRTIGEGNSNVRVTAELNFTEKETRRREVEEGSAVPIKSRILQETIGSGEAVVAGVPGVDANLAGDADDAGAGSVSRNHIRTTSENSYEVTVTETSQKDPVGTLTRLSVAALIDEMKTMTETSEAGETTGKLEKRSDAERKELEAAIRAAANMDAENERHQLTVSFIPFNRMEEQSDSVAIAALNVEGRNQIIRHAVEWGIVGFLGLLFALLVMRPAARALAPPQVTARTAHGPGGMALPSSDEQDERLLAGGEGGGGFDIARALESGASPESVVKLLQAQNRPETALSETLSQEISRVAQTNPDKAVQLLKKWMNG
ncbi:flagellar M-ring protein FliF [Candidatus Sumerlaeota bacterium]|nr:flagellar M-ring protein FliF [Candidatus Sumerlaeota bacterium]